MKLKHLLLPGLLAIVFIISSCEKKEEQPNEPDNSDNTGQECTCDSTQIFMVVEEMPEFPGGDEARMQYFADNTEYPEEALENGIEGSVYVTFVVEKDGSICGVRVLRGIGGGCDEEAVRLVEGMPDWNPGKQLGEPVCVQFNLPVLFVLPQL